MIRSFACKETARIWQGRSSRKFPGDLRNPPGNRLGSLKGARLGEMSIRVNDRWRLCFRWENGEAWDVEIVDRH